MLPTSTKSSQSLFKTKNNTPMAIFDLGPAFSLALGPNCAAASPATELKPASKPSSAPLSCAGFHQKNMRCQYIHLWSSMILWSSIQRLKVPIYEGAIKCICIWLFTVITCYNNYNVAYSITCATIMSIFASGGFIWFLLPFDVRNLCSHHLTCSFPVLRWSLSLLALEVCGSGTFDGSAVGVPKPQLRRSEQKIDLLFTTGL